jgi:hypothetical protein
VPFCVATTLLRGAPTMRSMTTYGDAAVNELTARVRLVADPEVKPLCCRIEVRTRDGRTLTREQRMTFADYAYDRAAVSRLVRRIGEETGVPARAYDRLDRRAG